MKRNEIIGNLNKNRETRTQGKNYQKKRNKAPATRVIKSIISTAV